MRHLWFWFRTFPLAPLVLMGPRGCLESPSRFTSRVELWELRMQVSSWGVIPLSKIPIRLEDGACLTAFRHPYAAVWKTSGVRNPSMTSLPSVAHVTARVGGVVLGLIDGRLSLVHLIQTRSSLSVSDNFSRRYVVSMVSSWAFLTLCCCIVSMLFFFFRYL